jgi:hypothetical protein
MQTTLDAPTKLDNPIVKPMIKPREELAWPLLPHEGVARAIALFNFDAKRGG